VEPDDEVEPVATGEPLGVWPQLGEHLVGRAGGREVPQPLVVGRVHLEAAPRRVRARRPGRVDPELVRDAGPDDLPGVPVLPDERVLQDGEPEVRRVAAGLLRALLGPSVRSAFSMVVRDRMNPSACRPARRTAASTWPPR
jgi:hypothetical protein